MPLAALGVHVVSLLDSAARRSPRPSSERIELGDRRLGQARLPRGAVHARHPAGGRRCSSHRTRALGAAPHRRGRQRRRAHRARSACPTSSASPTRRRSTSDAPGGRAPCATCCACRSASAPTGSTVLLDLKESAHGGMGPHGMVVGATGSGKSEMLRTLRQLAGDRPRPGPARADARRLQGRRDVRGDGGHPAHRRHDHQPPGRPDPRRPDARRAVRRDAAPSGDPQGGRQPAQRHGLPGPASTPARTSSRCPTCS